jgi:ribosomal protein L20
MYGLVLSGCYLNRKMLAEMAQTEPLSFRSIVEMSTSARKALAANKKPREVNSFHEIKK